MEEIREKKYLKRLEEYYKRNINIFILTIKKKSN